MERHDGLTRVTLPCRCGATIHAVGDPTRGLAALRHGRDTGPLGLHDTALVRGALVADRALLAGPRVRAWLRRYHGAGEAARAGGPSSRVG